MNKLYTEEQVQEAYNRGHMDGRLNNIDYSITDGFKPIELPSDDEIEIASPYVPRDAHDYYHGDKAGFIDGAKWLKEQIFNQIK